MITVVYVGKEILAFNCRESFLFVSVVLGNFQINTQFSEVTLFLINDTFKEIQHLFLQNYQSKVPSFLSLCVLLSLTDLNRLFCCQECLHLYNKCLYLQIGWPDLCKVTVLHERLVRKKNQILKAGERCVVLLNNMLIKQLTSNIILKKNNKKMSPCKEGTRRPRSWVFFV